MDELNQEGSGGKKNILVKKGGNSNLQINGKKKERTQPRSESAKQKKDSKGERESWAKVRKKRPRVKGTERGGGKTRYMAVRRDRDIFSSRRGEKKKARKQQGKREKSGWREKQRHRTAPAQNSVDIKTEEKTQERGTEKVKKGKRKMKRGGRARARRGKKKRASMEPTSRGKEKSLK